jgi:5'-methylthioadenosine phosphorylase
VISSICPLSRNCLGTGVGLEYQSMAMSTDYDCWHESEEEVTMEMIYAVMEKNVNNVKKLIEQVIPLISKQTGKEN